MAYENSTAAKNHSRRKKIAEFGQNLGQLIPGHTYDQDLDHVIHAPFRLFDQDHNRDHDKQVWTHKFKLSQIKLWLNKWLWT